MVTTREAAPAVRLNADWQAKYRQRAHHFLLQADHNKHSNDKLPLDQQQSVNDELLSVCIVGRSGVGKGSLINHLLQERAANVARFEADLEENTFEYHDLFCIREIPGYDGWHAVDSPSRRERFFQHLHRSSHGSHSIHSSHGSHSTHSGHGSSQGHGSSHSIHSSHGSHSSHSGHGSSNGKKKLTLDEFVQTYGLFEDETKAIIFVVNSRVTPDDEKLIELAVENRKFFCIVCTHADNLVQIADSALLKRKLDELEEQLRRDLCLIKNLNVRIFILSILSPEGPAAGAILEGHDLQCVMKNIKSLHFPLLKAYLSEPRGLYDELQIHGFVKEEVWKVLEPFQNVKKRHQALDFSEHFVAGTLLPIAGPVMVSFVKTLGYTVKACFDVGLIEDADDAMKKVSADANKHALSVKVASKEGLVTAVHDSMIHIFGKIVFEIALVEVITSAAEAAVSSALPLVGPVISAAHLPSRFKKIADKLATKTCLLHELWIMQNITGLLGKAE